MSIKVITRSITSGYLFSWPTGSHLKITVFSVCRFVYVCVSVCVLWKSFAIVKACCDQPDRDRIMCNNLRSWVLIS